MIDVKEAVGIAIKFIKEMYSDKDTPGLLLEEAEFDPEAKVWLITIGFDRPGRASAIQTIAGAAPPRAFKIIRIEAERGSILSLKIRD